MRKIIASLTSLVFILFVASCAAQSGTTTILSLPAASSLGTNDIFLIVQGGTTKRVNALQLVNLISNSIPIGTGSGGLATSQTNSPNLVFSAYIGVWTTNANFTSSIIGTPSALASAAQLIISNSSASFITNTFPTTAFDAGLGTNVSYAFIPPFSSIHLWFYWNAGSYYVESYGAIPSTALRILGGDATAFTNVPPAIYNLKSVTNDYAVSTNDTIIYAFGTNETITLPASPAVGQVFTVVSATDTSSVLLTNASGATQITSPYGHALGYKLGAWQSPSNMLTAIWKGTSY